MDSCRIKVFICHPTSSFFDYVIQHFQELDVINRNRRIHLCE